MNESIDTTSDALNEQELSDFLSNVLAEELLEDLVEEPRIAAFQYDGVGSNKPGLPVTIGAEVFYLLIIKT